MTNLDDSYKLLMESTKMEKKNHKKRRGSLGDSVTIIEPKSGWQIINFKELKRYRDLFFFLSGEILRHYMLRPYLDFRRLDKISMRRPKHWTA